MGATIDWAKLDAIERRMMEQVGVTVSPMFSMGPRPRHEGAVERLVRRQKEREAALQAKIERAR